MLGFKIIAEATDAPVSTEDLRNHLLLFGDTSFDTELASIIFVAQKLIADEIGEFPSATTIRQPYNSFSKFMPIRHNFVTSITQIQYYDSDDTLQTLSTDDYLFDEIGADKRAIVTNIPTDGLSSNYPTPVYMDYVAEMDPVPNTIGQAVLICAGELFKNRENTNDAQQYLNVINGSSLVGNLRRRYRQ